MVHLGSDEILTPSSIYQATAEFIATALFVFIGAGSVIAAMAASGNEMTTGALLCIAFAHGLAIMLLVSATANISGGHINPAVTIAAALTGEIGISKGILFIIAQVVGAIFGAFLLNIIVPDTYAGNLGAHGLGNLVDGTNSALLAEIILTFVLVFVIFATAIDKRGLSTYAPAAIGLVVLVDHLVGVQMTGASMNPARSIGPAVIAGVWDDHWLYWVGPITGGLLAAFVYKLTFNRRP